MEEKDVHSSKNEKKKWKKEKTEFTRKAGQWCRENIKSSILILSTTLLIRDGFEKEDSIKTGKETIITPKLQSSTKKKNIQEKLGYAHGLTGIDKQINGDGRFCREIKSVRVRLKRVLLFSPL